MRRAIGTPVAVAMLTGLLVTNLWAIWQLNDVILQTHSGEDRLTTRAEEVAADLRAGRIQVIPRQQTNRVTVLVALVANERKYQTTLLEEWTAQSRYMFLGGIGVFTLQVVVAVALPIIGARRRRRIAADAD
jgi:hypothetical protein